MSASSSRPNYIVLALLVTPVVGCAKYPDTPRTVVEASIGAMYGDGNFDRSSSYCTKRRREGYEHARAAWPNPEGLEQNAKLGKYSVTIEKEEQDKPGGYGEAYFIVEVVDESHQPTPQHFRLSFYLVQEDGQWRIDNGCLPGDFK